MSFKKLVDIKPILLIVGCFNFKPFYRLSCLFGRCVFVAPFLSKQTWPVSASEMDPSSKDRMMPSILVQLDIETRHSKTMYRQHLHYVPRFDKNSQTPSSGGLRLLPTSIHPVPNWCLHCQSISQNRRRNWRGEFIRCFMLTLASHEETRPADTEVPTAWETAWTTIWPRSSLSSI